ncbi:MAG: hypothetical protein QOD07_2615 [Frankiaceae bacterium]|jgi:hypothetical protein|nr:hypothetical protein [Frankiaceae bacterium]
MPTPYKRAVLVLTALTAVAVPTLAGAAGPSPTDTLASTTASAPLPDETPETVGWIQPDFVDDPVNPVHQFTAQTDNNGQTDRVTPTVMRVDDKIAHPLDRWYLWVWRHGGPTYDAAHGGRMDLLTAPRLEGPWTDRGFVTPVDPDPAGYGPHSWTGGDVVWSPLHKMFYSFPHAHQSGCVTGVGACSLDTFEQESPDGVNWTTINGGLPVLPSGPSSYDAFETGYAKVLRLDQPDGTEKWLMVYRSGRHCSTCTNNTHEYYTLSVATANDVAGPWTKASYNPIYDPFIGDDTGQNKGGGLIGIDAVVRHGGYYEMVWQDGFLGDIYLTRSTNLRDWTDFAPLGTQKLRPTGRNRSAPIFASPRGPNAVVIVGADLVWDDQVGALTLVYLSWDAANLEQPPGTVSVNIARSVTGGQPLVGRND